MNRRSTWAISLLIAALAPAIAGCGGPSEEEQAKARQAAIERKEKAEEIRKQEVAKVAEELAEARQQECETAAKGLVDATSELNSRLSVGLSYADYVDQVADVRVAYDRVDFEDAEPECVQEVGLRLERALNEYASSARSWERCIDSYSCDEDDNTRRLQLRWDKARQQIETAEEALDDLGEPDEALAEQATTLVDAKSTPGGTTPE